MTIREALQEANKLIDPLDSSLLLIFTLAQSNLRFGRRGAENAEKNLSRTDLLVMGDESISNKEYEDFLSFVERRKNGECAAYITGKKEFWGLEFEVTPAVLVPRPETEILIEAALQLIGSREQRAENNKAKRKTRILDLCTGSGAIAIALKHELPELEVIATDISCEALEVAAKNAAKLLPNNNDITFLQGDLYKALPSSLLTVIVSNPPYIPSNDIQTLAPEVQKEPRLALDGGKTGLEIIERIITDAPNYLRRGGYLLLEADPRQMKEIENILANRGFKDIIIHKDLAGLDRVIGGRIE